MGTSPLDYVNNTRILKSCILLRSTEHSILDISEMVGFHSVSSFNRYFIKLMQMSPREYRKQMQQSEKKAENQSILEFCRLDATGIAALCTPAVPGIKPAFYVSICRNNTGAPGSHSRSSRTGVWRSRFL